MPVMPGFSFDEPTWATQPPEIRGSPERSTISNFMPLERFFSMTGICWAQDAVAMPTARIAPAIALLQRPDPALDIIAITGPKEAAPAARGNGRDGDSGTRAGLRERPLTECTRHPGE